MAGALAATLTLFVVCSAASAQVEMSAAAPTSGARMAGTVLDSITGDPIEGVLVRLDSGEQAMTDALGKFTFRDLPEGKRVVALLTADCRITWGEVTVLERFPRQVEFRLPSTFGAKAEEDRREREERQRSGSGRRLEAAEIDRLNVGSVTELIRRIAPTMVQGLAGQVGGTPSIVSGRNSSFMEDVTPVVVVDGVRIPNPDIALDQMRPSEVQVLEVMPGAAAGWEYGASGANGVIKITLRRGVPKGALERPEPAPCTVPGFPRR